MGFNKRYIRKEMILENVSNIPYVSRLVKADALIMDTWSDKFFKNFDFKWEKYQELREMLNDDVKFWSMHGPTLEHENYPKLKSLSNVLLNLKTDPSWVDILLVNDILKDKDMEFVESIDMPDDINGRFDKLVPWHIELIEGYYGH